MILQPQCVRSCGCMYSLGSCAPPRQYLRSCCFCRCLWALRLADLFGRNTQSLRDDGSFLRSERMGFISYTGDLWWQPTLTPKHASKPKTGMQSVVVKACPAPFEAGRRDLFHRTKLCHCRLHTSFQLASIFGCELGLSALRCCMQGSYWGVKHCSAEYHSATCVCSYSSRFLRCLRKGHTYSNTYCNGELLGNSWASREF